jgi:hypothetical protein
VSLALNSFIPTADCAELVVLVAMFIHPFWKSPALALKAI